MKSAVFGLGILLIFNLQCSSSSSSSNDSHIHPPPCSSKIYCYGRLLDVIQKAELDTDSKAFVDQKLLHSPESVEENFQDFMRSVSDHPNREETQDFVSENFGERGSEFVPWTPQDWTESPQFLEGIQDDDFRSFASDLNEIWKTLGRKVDLDVNTHSDRYSLIYVPRPVVVPGGRFTEFYYWDQYWILKGLIVSEMLTTVRGMIENFLYMVEKFHHVPNGGRIYYSKRSQPPLLIPMVQDYLSATNNVTFLRKHIATLDKEFNFWMRNRTVNVRKNGRWYRLARYINELSGPRPESYREDSELAQNLSRSEQDQLFINLKSGAESGWDFSSRWFLPEDTNSTGTLKDTRTRDIVPVDLNAYLYNNAKMMAGFHRLKLIKCIEDDGVENGNFPAEARKLGRTLQASYYEVVAASWKRSIDVVLWDEEDGCWFDYDLIHGKLRKEFYPSNIVPLWANIHVDDEDASVKPARIVNYLENSGALEYPGGIPTSLVSSGEQWDFPNGWAPLQHLVVDALDRCSGNVRAQEIAFELAERWVHNNYRAFKNSNNTMFEKYDVQSVGSPGGGGEYEVVVGFGWSNGVILDFLNRYGDRLSSNLIEE